MDVDSDNFRDAIPLFDEQVRSCDCLVIDLEMSGISLAKMPVSNGETLEQRYRKYRKMVDTYAVMQVGVAPTRLSTREGDGGQVAPFTFHLFPRPIEDVAHNPQVLLCSSTVAFHRSNQYNFQRWLAKGITFVSRDVDALLARRDAAEEDKVRKALAGGASPESGWGSIVLSNDRDRALVRQSVALIESMLADGASEVPLPSMNAFLAKAVHQQVDAMKLERPDARNLFIDSRHGEQRWMTTRVAMNVSWEERLEIEEKKLAARRQRTFDQLGFRHIWKRICGSGKPFVLHNGTLDLMFMYHYFEAPLPASLKEFKQCVSSLFSAPFFDTKVLAEAFAPRYNFKLTALREIHETLARRGDFAAPRTPEGFRKYTQPPPPPPPSFFSAAWRRLLRPLVPPAKPTKRATELYHEAGYDAMQTAAIFNHFMRHDVEHDDAAAGTLRRKVPPSLTNVINVNRCLFRLALGLDRDPTVATGYFRVLCDFPSAASEGQIRGWLAPFLAEGAAGEARSVELKWCHAGCAVVVVHRLQDRAQDPADSGDAPLQRADERDFSARLSQFLAGLPGKHLTLAEFREKQEQEQQELENAVSVPVPDRLSTQGVRKHDTTPDDRDAKKRKVG
ncbi:hypothetical protein DIPPA_31758 [Diplonema papillatum]|nr:hypothetical protein DIPPA_31758 [Diplonema papillatum]